MAAKDPSSPIRAGFKRRRPGFVLALACSLVLTGCGGAARVAAHPAAWPSAATASPAASPAAATTFTGTIVGAPGALVRFGPGAGLPVMDVDPAGRSDVFDAWFGVAGGPAWFHLADGRGWVSSAYVRGSPPPGVGPTAWAPPAGVPDATAAVLDIAPHLQQQRATCEVAALAMALASRGIVTDERTLLGLTGVDGRPPVLDGSGGIARWGNPNEAFVGDPNGNPPDHTGYGVYAAPIAKAAMRSGATVSAAGAGIAASAMYAAVLAGRPAVTWVSNDYRTDPLGTWQAWDGSQVRYSLREHAVLVIGVTPALVLVNDPWWGQRWHPRAEFEAAYATFGQMAVILD